VLNHPWRARRTSNRIPLAVASNVSSIICSWSRRAEQSAARLPDLKSHSFGCSIECEFDHLFLVETPSTIRYALLRISNRESTFDAWACTRAWARLARRKYLSRLTSGCYGILNGRSIECEFDHLFLVETPSTIRYALLRISNRESTLNAWACTRAQARLARRKYQSRLTSGCYGESLMAVASNVSSIIFLWSRRAGPSVARSPDLNSQKHPKRVGMHPGPGTACAARKSESRLTSGCYGRLGSAIGVGARDRTPPRPPNRTGGLPASGSPER
jgi:hypothetical protein